MGIVHGYSLTAALGHADELVGFTEANNVSAALARATAWVHLQ